MNNIRILKHILFDNKHIMFDNKHIMFDNKHIVFDNDIKTAHIVTHRAVLDITYV